MPTNRFITQAIQTKYIGPTNHRPGRVKAWCQARSLTEEWDHSLNSEENHELVAMLLAHALRWSGNWYQGALPGDGGYAFVQSNHR